MDQIILLPPRKFHFSFSDYILTYLINPQGDYTAIQLPQPSTRRISLVATTPKTSLLNSKMMPGGISEVWSNRAILKGQLLSMAKLWLLVVVVVIAGKLLLIDFVCPQYYIEWFGNRSLEFHNREPQGHESNPSTRPICLWSCPLHSTIRFLCMKGATVLFLRIKQE